MNHYISALTEYFIANEITWNPLTEDSISVRYESEDKTQQDLNALIYVPDDLENDADDSFIVVQCTGFANFKSNMTKGLILCHNLNCSELVKFDINGDGDMRCSTIQFVADIKDLGEICIRAANHIINTVATNMYDIKTAEKM